MSSIISCKLTCIVSQVMAFEQMTSILHSIAENAIKLALGVGF